MKIAGPEDLAEFLGQEKDALLSDWEAAVRKLPGEDDLSRPVLLNHVPVLIKQLIHDLRLLVVAERTAEVSRIHGQQRLAVGLSIRHVVEEYKLLRVCITDRAANADWVIGVEAGRLLHKIIDEAIKAAVDSYSEQRDKDEKARREEYISFVVHDLRSPLTAIYHAMLLLERRIEKVVPNDSDLAVGAQQSNARR